MGGVCIRLVQEGTQWKTTEKTKEGDSQTQKVSDRKVGAILAKQRKQQRDVKKEWTER